MAIYQRCVADLVETYAKLDLFRIVAADAGSCSQDNAAFTRSQGLHYLFAHYTLDVALHEDDHPWIEADPQGALVLALLRRVAYNLLALFRNVTLRSESSRMMPWRQLIGELRQALLDACDSDLITRRTPIPALAAASLSQPALG